MKDKKYSLSACDMTFTSGKDLKIEEYKGLSYNDLYKKIEKFCLKNRGRHIDNDVVFTVCHTDEFFMTPKVLSVLNYSNIFSQNMTNTTLNEL